MADKDIFDKAENLARRLFERLGAKLDDKLPSENRAALSQREIEDVVTKLERAVDTNLQTDASGVKRVAPNNFKVLFTYERMTDFTPQYTSALVAELKSSIYEYIVNRRYELKGQLHLVVTPDYFEKNTVVKASFDKIEGATEHKSSTGQAPVKQSPASTDTVTILLKGDTGEHFNFTIKAGESPISIGRSSSNRLQLHDNSVSREHCSIALRRGGAVIIADLSSANGTTVNSSQLQDNEARIIKEGDVIFVGDVKLIVDKIA